jgi:hypothetical protein
LHLGPVDLDRHEADAYARPAVTATIIDGHAVAEKIRAELRERAAGRAE